MKKKINYVENNNCVIINPNSPILVKKQIITNGMLKKADIKMDDSLLSYFSNDLLDEINLPPLSNKFIEYSSEIADCTFLESLNITYSMVLISFAIIYIFTLVILCYVLNKRFSSPKAELNKISRDEESEQGGSNQQLELVEND